MSNDKTGGPAFPQSKEWQDDMDAHERNPTKYGSPPDVGNGMTLLDHFAGLAMQSLVSNFNELETKAGGPVTELMISYQAYEFAAAMLKARKEVMK